MGQITCPVCGGKRGFRSFTPTVTNEKCPTCFGTGRVHLYRHPNWARYTTGSGDYVWCQDCNGKGKKLDYPFVLCTRCQGKGVVQDR